MRTLSVIAVVASLASFSTWSAQAQEQDQPLGAVSSEREFLARLEHASERELKVAYLQCSRAASEEHIGSGDASMCSLVYEALLKQVFGGDFEALLTWSRLHPNDTLETDVARGRAPTNR